MRGSYLKLRYTGDPKTGNNYKLGAQMSPAIAPGSETAWGSSSGELEGQRLTSQKI